VDADSQCLDARDYSDHPGQPRLVGHETRQADERQAAMTTDDFREYSTALINQLLAQGFERPITFTAIASDGLTTGGSSETITGTVLSGEKTTAPPGAFARYLLPIHLLFVDAKGRVAHGVIGTSGTSSVRILP
jgi:hypothetical protein